MGGRRAGRTIAVLVLGALIVSILMLLHQGRGTAEGEPGAGAVAPPVVLPAADAKPSALAPELPRLDDAAVNALTASASATTGETSLRVRVTWASDGTPAADLGLQILAWDVAEPRRYARVVRTDARGEWFGTPMPLGRVTAYTFVGPAGSTTLAAGSAGSIDLQIPAGVLVHGLVTDEQDHAVPGAVIWMNLGNFDDGAVVATADDRGRFTLRDVPPSPEQQAGPFLAAQSASHAPSGRVKVTGQAGEVVDVVLVVGGACGTVRGLVVDAANKPVEAATVRIGGEVGFPRTKAQFANKTLPSPAFQVSSGADGSFVVPGVPVGHQDIAAVCAGHSPCDTTCDVQPGENEVTLALPASARIAGTVRDAQGRPLAGAQLVIEPAYELLGSMATSGADGRYELRDVSIGSRLVTASEQDNGRDVRRVEVVAGADLDCDFQLGAGATISGTLLDVAGAPAPGWLVRAVVEVPDADRLANANERPATDRSRADGRFRLTNVRGGEQRLLVLGQTLGNIEVLVAEHVAPGASDLVLRLPEHLGETGGLTMRFVNESGAPLPATRVTPRKADSRQAWVPVVADEAGRLAIPELPVTDWMLDVTAAGLPQTTLGPFEVAPGAATGLGDLVVKRGGTLLVHLHADGPLDQGWVRGTFTSASGTGAFITAEGDSLHFPALAPGPGELRVDSKLFATVQQSVEILAGAEATIDVKLVAGVLQRLRIWAPQSALQSATGPRLRLLIRDAAGAVVLSRDMQLPAQQGAAPDPSLPFIDWAQVLAPGAYSVDVAVGEASMTASFTASADAPWDLDLR